ncbi:MAG: alanine racemase [Thermodesulfobacteriota bacterium]|nr:alanine racemase [Thermodesulfobacteriota bacterium]
MIFPEDIETPCVVVDHERLLANISLVQDKADANWLKLCPHVKTHKSLEIARLQMDAGAKGVTASKTDEALVFMAAGLAQITCAYPIISRAKLDRLFAGAKEYGPELRMIADSAIGIDALARGAARHEITPEVFLKIDVGLHRCGVRENDPALVRLARHINDAPELEFAGLLSHAGQSYGAVDSEGVREIASEECRIMNRVRETLEKNGIQVPEVSVGSTPTVLAANDFDGITEIRPGNYVFMDLAALRLGLIEKRQVALSVLASVVSVNADYFIIDAGSKTLSSDLGAHGKSQGGGYGQAFALQEDSEQGRGMTVVKLSEEHGFLDRAGHSLAVGDRVRIIPNHSCAVVNLTDSLTVLGPDGPPLTWPVAARGRVR